MNQELEQLVLLQAIDLETDARQREFAEGPRRVRRAETDLAGAERELHATETSLRDEDVLRRSQGLDADGHRAKLTKLRRQMDAATSAAQVAALEHEIGFAAAAVSRLEDEELASLERSEVLEAKLPVDRGVAERLRLSHAAVVAEVAGNADRLRGEIADRDRERSAVRKGIPEARLVQYDRVRRSRGTAVSEARAGKCLACQMVVRPQRWNDVSGRDHEDEIFTCETCGRMLFFDARQDRPGLWPVGDRFLAAGKAGG